MKNYHRKIYDENFSDRGKNIKNSIIRLVLYEKSKKI